MLAKDCKTTCITKRSSAGRRVGIDFKYQIVLDFACTVTHKTCENRPLNIEKLNNAVSTKRIFEETPRNVPRKTENNNEFDICKENLKKSISSSAHPTPKNWDSASAKNMRSPPPRTLNSAFFHLWSMSISEKRFRLNQGCQTYGPRAKTGPLRGWIRPAGWFCKVKTSLFAWEVYPIILR